MRVSVVHIILQAARIHYLENVLLHFFRAALEELMRYKSLFDYLTYGHTRVQRRIRVLENDLQVFSQKTHFGILQSSQIDAVVKHCFVFGKLFVARILCFLFVYRKLDFCRFAEQLFFVRFKRSLGFFEFFNLFLCGFRFCRIFRKIGFKFGDVEVDIVYLLLNLFRLKGQTVLRKKHIRAFFRVTDGESAENFGNIVKRGFGVASRKILVLQFKERCGIALFVALFCKFVCVLLRFMIFRNIFFGIFQGVYNIFGGNCVKRSAVIHSAARGLFVKLEKHTSERRFSAAGLTDETERFALINVEGYILVCSVVYLFGEDGRLRHREILFKIRNRQ